MKKTLDPHHWSTLVTQIFNFWADGLRGLGPGIQTPREGAKMMTSLKMSGRNVRSVTAHNPGIPGAILMWECPPPWGSTRSVLAARQRPAYANTEAHHKLCQKSVIFVFTASTPTRMPKMIKIQDFRRSNLRYSTDYIQRPT